MGIVGVLFRVVKHELQCVIPGENTQSIGYKMKPRGSQILYFHFDAKCPIPFPARTETVFVNLASTGKCPMAKSFVSKIIQKIPFG